MRPAGRGSMRNKRDFFSLVHGHSEAVHMSWERSSQTIFGKIQHSTPWVLTWMINKGKEKKKTMMIKKEEKEKRMRTMMKEED